MNDDLEKWGNLWEKSGNLQVKCSATYAGAIQESSNYYRVPFLSWISRSEDSVHSIAKVSVIKKKKNTSGGFFEGQRNFLLINQSKFSFDWPDESSINVTAQSRAHSTVHWSKALKIRLVNLSNIWPVDWQWNWQSIDQSSSQKTIWLFFSIFGYFFLDFQIYLWFKNTCECN